MARAISDLPCRICNKTFRHIMKHNSWKSTQAETYVDWTRDNLFVCPECLSKIRTKEDRDQMAAVRYLFESTYGILPHLEQRAEFCRDRFLLEVYRACAAEAQSNYKDCTKTDIDMMWLTIRCLTDILDFDRPWEMFSHTISPSRFISRLVAEYVIEFADWFKKNEPEYAPIICDRLHEKIMKERRRREEIKRLGPFPAAPEFIGDSHWNKKVYGKNGSFYVFLDGKKKTISDGQEKEANSWKKRAAHWEAARKRLNQMIMQ